MLILVCGGREWTDREKIAARIRREPRTTAILHGAQRGADSIAGAFAASLGMPVFSCPANWTRYRTAAGPIRNRWMLDLVPHLVIAFHADIENSKGTKDCVTEARRRGIPVEVIS